MKKQAIVLILVLMLSAFAQARSLVIYTYIENQTELIVYIRVCASNDEYDQAMKNCPSNLTNKTIKQGHPPLKQLQPPTQ
ncbi:MAG: hypothetical protein ABW168_07295 [Sedimenticola sp.]